MYHGGLVLPLLLVLARAEERRDVGDVPDLPLDGVELERQAEGGREVREAAAGGIEDVERCAAPLTAKILTRSGSGARPRKKKGRERKKKETEGKNVISQLFSHLLSQK